MAAAITSRRGVRGPSVARRVADPERASPPQPTKCAAQPRRHTAGQFDPRAAQRTRVKALLKARWAARDVARDVGWTVDEVLAVKAETTGAGA